MKKVYINFITGEVVEGGFIKTAKYALRDFKYHHSLWCFAYIAYNIYRHIA